MFNLQMIERLSLLRAKGGKIAAAYWLLRAILRIDTYRFYAIDLADFSCGDEADLPEDYRFLRFENAEEVARCEPGIMQEIDRQSGRGVFNIVSNGGRAYAIVHDREVICQLNIEFRRSYVDTPLKMTFEFGEKDAFLTFLYSNPAWRRSRWAFRLISRVCALLSQEGWLHCACHVQATNVKSYNTFRRCGWETVAFLFATTGGRLLGVVHCNVARNKKIYVHTKLCKT